MNNTVEDTSTGDTSASKKYTRMTADFTPEAYQTLSEVATRFGGSKAEAVRRALGLLNYLLRQKDQGWTLVLEKDGERKEIVTL